MRIRRARTGRGPGGSPGAGNAMARGDAGIGAVGAVDGAGSGAASGAPGAVTAAGRWRGFASCAAEGGPVALQVDGRLPGWLDGSLHLNGPGLFELPCGGYRHWFDGLALLQRIELRDGAASWRSRFLRGEAWRAAQARGAPDYGEFETPDAMGWLTRLRRLGAPKLTDNGAVIVEHMGDDWLARTETSRAQRIDPDTLETLGPLDWNDAETMPFAAAHGVRTPDGRSWGAGIEVGRHSRYLAYAIDPGSRRRRVLARIPADPPGLLHDLAVSGGHLVLWENALRIRPLGFALTRRAYRGNLAWRPGLGSRLHAVDIATGAVRSWDAPPLFAFHALQAFEDGDAVVVDLCALDDPGILDRLRLSTLRAGRPIGPIGRLRRYVLRPGASRAEVSDLGASMEFPQPSRPRGAGGKARFAWGADRGSTDPEAFFDRTVKLDLETGTRLAWQRGDAVQLEPVFVPRPGALAEDDGVLCVPTLADGDAGSVVAVLDAASMRPLAWLRLPAVVPFAFHGLFRPRIDDAA